MSSREKILGAVKKNQPGLIPLSEKNFVSGVPGSVQQFEATLKAIGAQVFFITDGEDIISYIENLFPEAKRLVSSVTSIEKHFINDHKNVVHNTLQDVDVSVIKAQFGVAENGAVWVTEDDLKIRVLPFICEHLVAIVDSRDILSNMHEAYERVGSMDYGFAAFIAGPSKTADIEQSLVLGAHGPKSMSVLIRRSNQL